MPVLGFSASEWAVISHCIWSLQMAPSLGSLASEWLLCIPHFILKMSVLCLLRWWVANLLCFKPLNGICSLFFRKWVAAVPFCTSSLLMMPVVGSLECEWVLHLVASQVCWEHLSLALSLWVLCLTYCIAKLLTISGFHFLGCEWPLCPAVFQAFQAWYLFCFLSKWVATICCILSMLIGSSVCEWLPCLAMFFKPTFWPSRVWLDHILLHFLAC